ncbi:hypothetical protein [uncultured Halomonas sp.]|uniref:hypothetical protein n=1 Tax=uncultured Halomonas sp. TaxID=173971 RepID=UPI00260A5D76|nr:hypothetical protein [uncultured Halomonas sp.]
MATFTACILIDARSAGARLPRQLAVMAPLAQAAGDVTFTLWVLDDTGDVRLPRIAQRFGARLVSTAPLPLGQRLNEAIASSNGDILVFPGIGNATGAEALARLAAEVAAGKLDAATLPTRHAGRLARLLARLRRLPRGDGLCLSRNWFERIGGCDPELDERALGELLERLQACGVRIRPARVDSPSKA